MKKILQIELNEFSSELLGSYAEKFNFRYIKYFLNLQHINTYTNEVIEHRDLDPWVQWVSVHTGVPLQKHGIKYLGGASTGLNDPQIWNELSDAGISTGIWCVMNGKFEDSENLVFYFSDPWSSNGDVKPEVLNLLLYLPLYFSRNYLNLKISRIISGVFKFIKFTFKVKLLNAIFSNTLLVLESIKFIKNYTIVLFALFDLISVEAFIKFKKKYNPQYSIILLNSIAHMQHHDWIKSSEKNINYYVLKVVNRILYKLLSNIDKETALILMNGFTQKFEELDYFCYRQIDPYGFIEYLEVSYEKIIQGMTNDSILVFHSFDELKKTELLLKNAEIDGHKLFFVDFFNDKDYSLFYRVDIKIKVSKNSIFSIGGRQLKFYDHFKVVANRTGSHVPYGDLYYKDIYFKDKLRNDEINKYIKEYFK